MKPILHRLQEYTKKTEKIYIVPTQAGLIYIGVNFTLFLMGLVYANNLALLLAFSLFSVLLLIMFQTHSILEKLVLGKITQKSAGVDESPGLFIWPPLPPTAQLVVQKDGKDLLFMRHREQEGLYALEKPRRQKVVSNYVKIFTRGESELFYVWTHRKTSINFHVYPKKLITINKVRPFNEFVNSDNGQFREHKAYQVGEHASRIDWKVFARSEQLLVKNFEDDVSQSLLIDVDSEDGDLEERLSKAAFRMTEANRKSLSWALKAGNSQLPLSKGPTHLKMSMEVLSEY